MTNRRAARIQAAPIMLAVAVMSAGCGDVTATSTRFDPHLTLDRLDEVLAPLDGEEELLLGLDLAVATLDYYGGAGLADAISLRADRYGRGLRSLRRAPRPGGSRPGGADGVAFGVEGFTVPWMVAGETLEWDRTDGYVVSGRTGAPADGVRFLLYRMDRETGYPIMPLSQVGHLDLVDQDTGNEEAVRVRALRTAGPDRVIADYRVSLTGSGSYDEGWMEIRTRGAFGGAAAVDLGLSQRMDWSRSRNRDELRLDYEYRRGSAGVELHVGAQSRYDALDWETFDFGVAIRGGREATDIDADVRSDGSLRGEIRSNGRRVIWIGGYDGRPTFEAASGTALSRSDQVSLDGIWMGITDLLWLTDWVMVPADLLLAGG